jgi:NAD(P)-dependent dehydrogenase (short-subunit alcohol dehydrogenase family)
VTTDVTDEAAVESLAKAAIDEFGGLDIWVNNAGGSPLQAPLAKLSRADWDASLSLNLTAVWVGTSVASRHMRDGGRVVNISSRAATMPIAGSGHYAAAKAGVNSLTQTFAQELGPRIRVNAIMPGAVPTEIMMQALGLGDDDLKGLEKGLRLPMRRLGTPEDLGAAALYLVSPASSWVTGHILSVTGGM